LPGCSKEENGYHGNYGNYVPHLRRGEQLQTEIGQQIGFPHCRMNCKLDDLANWLFIAGVAGTKLSLEAFFFFDLPSCNDLSLETFSSFLKRRTKDLMTKD
jgi:hypothetical protein